MAVNTQGKWQFKPSAEYQLLGGDVLMVMASADARLRMEAIVKS
jgi:hypothetical protein